MTTRTPTAATTAALPVQATRAFRIWMALVGIIGVVMQVFSFSINPGPPAGATVAQVIEWGKQNANLVLIGAWTQGVSSFLLVIFIFALVYLAGESARPLGWITLLASAVLVSISLVEASFYISAVQGGESGNITVLTASMFLIAAIQHAYVIAPATAFLLSIGFIITRSHVLPVWLGYIGLALGVVIEILGLIGLFIPFQTVVNSFLTLQEVWFLACAIALLILTLRTRGTGQTAGTAGTIETPQLAGQSA